jgi:hypothetical protein
VVDFSHSNHTTPMVIAGSRLPLIETPADGGKQPVACLKRVSGR